METNILAPKPKSRSCRAGSGDFRDFLSAMMHTSVCVSEHVVVRGEFTPEGCTNLEAVFGLRAPSAKRSWS